MPVKLIEIINSADRLLDQAGIEAPRRNVERILEKILGLSRVELYLNPAREVRREQETALQNLLQRRLEGEPLQYILGETEFYGVSLHCDRRALIPRPETEFVVSKGLELIGDRQHLRLLDLACGSGNIAIATAVNNPHQQYYASDISADALALARENAALNRVSELIDFRCGNMFAPFADNRLNFDLILANPPYIRNGDLNLLHEQVKRYEPHRALLGGEDGLDFIRQMLAEAPAFLSPGGYLVCEVAMGQAPVLLEMIRTAAVFEWLGSVRDYSGIERVIVLRLPGLGSSRAGKP